MDATNSTSDSSTDTSGARIAEAVASVFNTGINAYVDSQYGSPYVYQDPRYYQNGYPGGVASNTTTLRAVANTPMALLLGVGLLVVVFLALRK